MPKIENQNQNPRSDQAHEYSHFVGVKFVNTPRAYFFGTNDADFKLDDKVVVETVRGTELGTIAIEPIDIKKYANGLFLKPIVRRATDVDIRLSEINQKDAVYALEICTQEAKKLNLDMNLISCEYTLDKSKVIFSYLADDRVDFRELLKVLASRLRTRIELRQIGSRDKAKISFRLFSRNIQARYDENARFVNMQKNFRNLFSITVRRFRERKDYRFRTCPQCKKVLRLPNKKGRHNVICPNCHKEFEVKI